MRWGVFSIMLAVWVALLYLDDIRGFLKDIIEELKKD